MPAAITAAMGTVKAIKTRRARSIVSRNPAQFPRAANSERVGSRAVAMAVPRMVSGTCITIQP